MKEAFNKIANKAKICVLCDLDNGFSLSNALKQLKDAEIKEQYAFCEGIKQAIEIKQKENKLSLSKKLEEKFNKL